MCHGKEMQKALAGAKAAMTKTQNNGRILTHLKHGIPETNPKPKNNGSVSETLHWMTSFPVVHAENTYLGSGSGSVFKPYSW
jgi:hypothetical protein